jgi:hypothetical protein
VLYDTSSCEWPSHASSSGDTFAITGTEISFANGRNTEIEETILRLDEPANTVPSDVSSGLRPTY